MDIKAEMQCMPLELLILIAESFGGANLRRNVHLLTLFKAWYAAARPVYYSGRDQTALRLPQTEVMRFATHGQRMQDLVLLNTKSLRIRLRGHHWDTIAGYCWQFLGVDSSGPNQPPTWWSRESGTKALSKWRQDLNSNLHVIGSLLSGIEHLDKVELAASSEIDPDVGPRWDYLDNSSVVRIVQGLIGRHLTSFTLDTSGSALVASEGQRPVHVCPLVAQCLPTIENVRLRMRHICPEVFPMDVQDPDSQYRLRNLEIKMHIPDFPDATIAPQQELHYRAAPCPMNPKFVGDVNGTEKLLLEMVNAGRKFASSFDDDTARTIIISGRVLGESLSLFAEECATGKLLYPWYLQAPDDNGNPTWWVMQEDWS